MSLWQWNIPETSEEGEAIRLASAQRGVYLSESGDELQAEKYNLEKQKELFNNITKYTVIGGVVTLLIMFAMAYDNR